MNKPAIGAFGYEFERILVGALSIGISAVLVFLAVNGPLFLGNIQYKTAQIVNNQLVGQDVVNLFVVAVISLLGGVALLAKKEISKYLLISTPLFLLYYSISYIVGLEWSSTIYTGNSQQYTFHFLFVLISALIILLYSLSVFPRNVKSSFKKSSLIVYSSFFVFFLLAFASMWIGEIIQVMQTGTSRGYDLSPTVFWLVRAVDLGFCIPFGLISVYLLWTRPNTSFSIQILFYGFFFTQMLAVNAMGLMMMINNDPTFLLRDLAVFSILGVIIIFGFVFIVKNYKILKPETEI